MGKMMDTQQQNSDFFDSRYSDVTVAIEQAGSDFEPSPAGCLYEDVVVNVTSG